MEKTIYGTTAQGKTVDTFTLRNKNGLAMQCISYGCCITHLFVPDGKGGTVDIVLGFDDLYGYEHPEGPGYQGAFVGRYAGRICGAAFDLDGSHYDLLKNDGENYRHGTMAKKLYNAEPLGDNSIRFTGMAEDGEDGFPGRLDVSVTYTLTDKNELVIDYLAHSNRDTHVNLTNHSYFNLAGSGDILDHTLQLNCDLFMEGDAETLPTGRLLETAGGAFDFSQPKPIGRDIEKDDPQLNAAKGYDHCFVINREQPEGLVLCAVAAHPQSGRWMRVFTTQPAVVFYTANYLDGSHQGKYGPLGHRCGLCLETQHYPDSPNQPNFPSTLLREQGAYHHTTIYQFGWEG